MYLEHFGFNRHPFRITPEEDLLYMSLQHSRALVFMESAVWNNEGFVVISGEIGAGKTTLLKKLTKDQDEDALIIQIAANHSKEDELLKSILTNLDPGASAINPVNLFSHISALLLKLSELNSSIILAIDEAQNLSLENLENIRLLAGIEGSKGPVIKVILLGQPEIRNLIEQLPQLMQRTKLFYHLKGLTLEDTESYIQHRLKLSGNSHAELFPKALVQLIHREATGIPRMINKISDGLLLCAYAEDRHHLEMEDIEEIRDELMLYQPEVIPNDTLASVDPESLKSDLNRIAIALERIADHLDKKS